MCLYEDVRDRTIPDCFIYVNIYCHGECKKKKKSMKDESRTFVSADVIILQR